jgi:far upstream element-binding protein
MLLIQENQASSTQPKPLRITGTPDKVEQAKRAVELLLSNDENNRMGGGGNQQGGGMMMSQQRSVGEVIVPRSSVGIIIGKGGKYIFVCIFVNLNNFSLGETIKRLASESGTKIQFKPDGESFSYLAFCVP